MTALRSLLALGLLSVVSLGAQAQTSDDVTTLPVVVVTPVQAVAPEAPADKAVAPASTLTALPADSIGTDPAAITTLFPNLRPPDRRGVTVFETPKSSADRLGSGEPRLRIGAAFAQQFQGLGHINTADPVMVTGTGGTMVDQNQLMDIGPGFNNATANLTFDALLADGIHVNLVTYLSARHHNEAWVKGGYLQVDALPFFHNETVDRLMQYVTLRLGHFEVNYGDAHFRRTDNGNALYNPFVGNYVLDAFTTEIGGDLLVRRAGVFGMLGLTGGEISGNVTNPDGRSLAVIGKVGVDRQLSPDLRVRLSGSMYRNGNAGRNTLYRGDRAGSRYYLVLENTAATTSANAWSGLLDPGFTEEITAFMVNPFVKFHGAELFGTFEHTSGRSALEAETVGRAWSQVAIDGVFRFLPQEQAYVGARYNVAWGALAGAAVDGQITTAGADVSVARYEIGAGWFPTRNLLLKAEYVRQSYRDFPGTDIRNGGRFDGFMLEGVVSF